MTLIAHKQKASPCLPLGPGAVPWRLHTASLSPEPGGVKPASVWGRSPSTSYLGGIYSQGNLLWGSRARGQSGSHLEVALLVWTVLAIRPGAR